MFGSSPGAFGPGGTDRKLLRDLISQSTVEFKWVGLTLTNYQVDGHTLSSVSLASVGCPDPALLSNIFQVQYNKQSHSNPAK